MSIENVRCPRCNRPTAVTSNTTLRAYYCTHCTVEFEPEEDGRFGYGDPARQVANREEWELRQKQRRRAGRRA